jgi:metal-responsive CopG/Arc/MetJ family transcriptional regulator
LNISMDERLVARIDRRARELGESRSGFLAAAAKSRLASL